MSTQDVAITAANSVREVASTEHQIIMDYCIPRYKNAGKPEDVLATDKVCEPAKESYLATKGSWELLVLALGDFKAGKASEADIVKAADKLAETLVALKQVVGGMR